MGPMRRWLAGGLAGILVLVSARAWSGETYTWRDDRVEAVVERLPETFQGQPLLDITVTNRSPQPLDKVTLELRFYDAKDKLITRVELPVVAFDHVDRVKYAAPAFARVEVGPVRYTIRK